MVKANDFQIGGTHYKTLDIQSWDAITAWGLGFLDGNVVKYMSRWRKKAGLQDLLKAQHYLSKLIEEVESALEAKQQAAKLNPQAAAAKFSQRPQDGNRATSAIPAGGLVPAPVKMKGREPELTADAIEDAIVDLKEQSDKKKKKAK